MSTESFINTYVIEREDVERFSEIMKTPRLKISQDVKNLDVKGAAALELLGLERKWVKS